MTCSALVVYPAYLPFLSFMTRFDSHLVDSSRTLVRFISMKYEVALDDTEITNRSGSCDSLPVRRASEAVFPLNVALQATK